MWSMKTLADMPNPANKLVLVRSGLNAPMHNNTIIADFRIRKAVPTLTYLCERGAKVVVISHIGHDGNESLHLVAELLAKHVPTQFVATIEEARLNARAGVVMLVENLRSDPREKANDATFAQELAEGFDYFVQDAFEVCHREHASVVGIPKYLESCGGLLVQDEVRALTRARSPKHPALFILGGGKPRTKEPLLDRMLDIYDTVLIGGTLQNEILAARGFQVGRSVVESRSVLFSVLTTRKAHEVEDVLVEHDDGGVASVPVEAVAPTDTIVDMGRTTITKLIERLHEFETIVWNGPLGWYERGYDDSTTLLARAIANTDAVTIIGGGDTVAVIEKEGLTARFSFVSTGGGAMLQFLQYGTLPGIEALG